METGNRGRYNPTGKIHGRVRFSVSEKKIGLPFDS